MKPNRFGYKQDPADKENARLLKEENYVNVKKLLTAYGPIDYIYWDVAGWRRAAPTPMAQFFARTRQVSRSE